MAIVDIKKIRLLVHKGAGAETLKVLQKMGLVQFTEIEGSEHLQKGEKNIFEFNYISSRLDFAINFFSRFEEEKGGLRRALEGSRILLTEEEIEHTAQSFYFEDIIEQAQDLEEKLNDSEGKIKALEQEEALLSAWESLDAPLSSGLETKRTSSILLKGDIDDFKSFIENLDQHSLRYYSQEISFGHFLTTVLKEEKEVVEKLAGEYSLDCASLPHRRGTPGEELARIRRAKKNEEDRKKEYEEQARKTAQQLPQLKIVGDRMLWRKEKHDVLSSAPRTKHVLIFEGWCPDKKIPALKTEISKQTPYFEIEVLPLKEGEEAPVEIENNALVTPFETITRLYGLPGNKDLDPTVFLAGFFFIFFGFCLTDVGYGIFLALITGSVLFFFKLPKEIKPLVTLLMLGGVASALLGLLFGGYLGIDMQYLPAWARAIQKFDPIANPLPIFYLSLALGVIHILFGLFLGIVREFKNKTPLDGVLGQGPWIFLLISLIIFGAEKTNFVHLSFPAAWIVYASIASLILTQGRNESTIGKKIFKGVASLYDSVGYLSDILSYSRLLALGLATSALAFAINLIATLIGDMIPYVGGVLMVIILVIGHIFNIVVNTLGAFIHSARLQFVEFFGKFITGSGKNFNPFKRAERYIVVK